MNPEEKRTLSKLIEEIEALRRRSGEFQNVRAFLSQTREGVVAYDLTGRVTWANEAFARMHGYGPDELIGKNIDTVRDPADAGRLREALERMRAGEPFSGLVRHRRKDGSPLAASVRSSALWDEQGRPTGYLTVCGEPSERDRREEELRRQRDEAKYYFDFAGVMLVVIDADERISTVNRKASEILGYTADEIVGRNWFDLAIPERVREDVRGAFRKLIAGQVEPVEYFQNPVVTRDGSERLILWHNSVLTGQDGRITGTISSGEDVTERERTRQALRRSEERYRTVADFTHDWEYWLDPSGEYLYVSPSCVRITGYTAEEFMADPDLVARITHPDDRDRVRQHLVGPAPDEQAGEEDHSFDFRIVTRTGEERWLSHVCRAIYDRAGTYLGRRGSNRDITPRKHAEEALRRANELKTDFIRVAGHELRTPICYIIGIAQLLKDSREPERLSAALGNIAAKARRLNEIVEAMFKLMPERVEGDRVRYRRVDLGELLRSIRGEFSAFLQERRQHLDLDVEEGIEPVEADPDKLRDIVENLLTNAIKFTPDGGRVSVRARSQPEDRVLIEVADQGPGIDPEELPHLFKPFYSGADVMKHSTGVSGYRKAGMGLGLAVVKHFVDLHGGSVDVSTSPEGSVFHVSLPVQAPAEPYEPRSAPVGRSE